MLCNVLYSRRRTGGYTVTLIRNMGPSGDILRLGRIRLFGQIWRPRFFFCSVASAYPLKKKTKYSIIHNIPMILLSIRAGGVDLSVASVSISISDIMWYMYCVQYFYAAPIPDVMSLTSRRNPHVSVESCWRNPQVRTVVTIPKWTELYGIIYIYISLYIIYIVYIFGGKFALPNCGENGKTFFTPTV